MNYSDVMPVAGALILVGSAFALVFYLGLRVGANMVHLLNGHEEPLIGRARQDREVDDSEESVIETT